MSHLPTVPLASQKWHLRIAKRICLHAENPTNEGKNDKESTAFTTKRSLGALT